MTESAKLDLILSKLNKMDERLNTIEMDVKSIKITIEIIRVAEGQLHMAKELQEAMNTSREMEELALRVREMKRREMPESVERGEY